MSIDFSNDQVRAEEPILTTSHTLEDDNESSLRPKTLREYIGQEKAKGNLQVFIEAARMRQEPLDHVLLYGPPGLGKTTLSGIIANEMGVNLRITSGPAIEKPGDLAALLTNLNENDILFVDEIHRLNRSVEEILYPAMEEDLFLIRAGAVERRRFLDDTIAQLRPRYAEALERYQKIWKSKSFILNHQEERPDLLATLDDFSHQLCQAGAVITHYRAHFIKRLAGTAPAIHREFSGGREALSLAYEPDSAISDPLAPTKVLFEQLMEHQECRREAELAARKCLIGPHRDELRVDIDGRSDDSFP